MWGYPVLSFYFLFDTPKYLLFDHCYLLTPHPLQERRKNATQECPTRVSYKSGLEEHYARVSIKSAAQACPTRVFLSMLPENV